MTNLAEYLANAKGDRSIDAIAAQATKAGYPISRSAVAKYLRGEHGPRIPQATLQGLAAGFGVDVRELRLAAGRPAGELGPYVPTTEAAALTQRQRDALDYLIKAFVIEEGGTTDVGSTEAQKSSDRRSTGGAVVVVPFSREDLARQGLAASQGDGVDYDTPDA